MVENIRCAHCDVETKVVTRDLEIIWKLRGSPPQDFIKLTLHGVSNHKCHECHEEWYDDRQAGQLETARTRAMAERILFLEGRLASQGLPIV